MTVSQEAILGAFDFRFATKTYDPTRKLAAEEFALILEAAQRSPSSFGFEPWNIIVVQNEELRNALLPDTWGAQGTLPTASHFVVLTAKTGENLGADSKHINYILSDIKRMAADDQQGMLGKFADWQENDFSLTTAESRHQWGARQAYIVLGNMMTVAAMRGIDSQPIEGFNIAKVAALLAKHQLLDPATDLPVVMVSFGYRAMEAMPKTRRPLDQIVTWA